MADVTFGAKATTPGEGSGVGYVEVTSLTVGSESNRVLLVQIAWSSGTLGTPVVTWDYGGSAQACSLIKYDIDSNGRQASLYGLVNPAAGNLTLRVTSPNNVGLIASACYFYNADQTGGTTTFRNAASNTGNSSSPSLAITSATGERTQSVMSAGTTSGSTDKTLLWFVSGSGAEDGGADYAAGAATVTHTWTTDSVPWVVVGCSIKAEAGTQDIALRSPGTNAQDVSLSGASPQTINGQSVSATATVTAASVTPGEVTLFGDPVWSWAEVGTTPATLITPVTVAGQEVWATATVTPASVEAGAPPFELSFFHRPPAWRVHLRL
jgi:hypothetical protein